MSGVILMSQVISATKQGEEEQERTGKKRLVAQLTLRAVREHVVEAEAAPAGEHRGLAVDAGRAAPGGGGGADGRPADIEDGCVLRRGGAGRSEMRDPDGTQGIRAPPGRALGEFLRKCWGPITHRGEISDAEGRGRRAGRVVINLGDLQLHVARGGRRDEPRAGEVARGHPVPRDHRTDGACGERRVPREAGTSGREHDCQEGGQVQAADGEDCSKGGAAVTESHRGFPGRAWARRSRC